MPAFSKMIEQDGIPLRVRAIFFEKEHMGMVAVDTGDQTFHMSPQQAREIAQYLNEAAECAQQETFLVCFTESFMGFGHSAGQKMLEGFREFREAEKARYQMAGLC